jgi:hypothetical protein
MLTFVRSMRPITLLGYDASGCLKHLDVRQEDILLLRHGYHRPGFWDKAAYGQWRLIPPRDQEADPALAEGVAKVLMCYPL